MKPFPFHPVRLPALAACLLALLASGAHAQSVEEFVLRNGKRIPAASVKTTANGFAANVVTGASVDNVTFTAKDVLRATLREPGELSEARNATANGKPTAAIATLTKAEEELAPFKKVPGSWWYRALMLRMDAMSVKGEAAKAAALVNDEVLASVPEEAAALLTDFKAIIAKPAEGPDAKIAALQSLAKRTSDPWITARAWIEVGNTLDGQGKIEDAVKAWLRAAIFNPAERDLAARGTILAARGLQQIDRPKDGVKLLEDYLKDQLSSPYESAIKAEAARIEPKKETDEAAPAEPVETPEPSEDPEPAETPEPTENSN
jgi:tetratricopeptide (TPR) repeat protein